MSQSNPNQGASAAENCENCGFEASNKKHYESYWEGRSDPRDKDDSYMKFNSVYYNMIDRQIAENHHTECLGNPKTGGNGSATSSKK